LLLKKTVWQNKIFKLNKIKQYANSLILIKFKQKKRGFAWKAAVSIYLFEVVWYCIDSEKFAGFIQMICKISL